MITREDVVGCYKYILGRDPESDDVIERCIAAQFKSEGDLGKHFLWSPELLNSGRLSIESMLPPLIYQKPEIACYASKKETSKILERIQEEWENFGKNEPYWSVIVEEDFKNANIDENKDRFYESGSYVIHLINSILDRNVVKRTDRKNSLFRKIIGRPLEHPVKLDRSEWTCFELGCGVGRITTHLANSFKRVIAADISKYHLELCSKEAYSRGIYNIEQVLIKSPKDIEGIDGFDLFISLIVLQHSPPPIIALFLRSILKRLRRGGVAIFQVPVWQEGYDFNLQDYLGDPKPLDMEMHAIPQHEIFGIVRESGCHVVEVREDGWTGRSPGRLSNIFCVLKD